VKVGDLVIDDFSGLQGLVVSEPWLSEDCDGFGDAYKVVDVLCIDGSLRLFDTDELRVISESR